MYAAPLFLQTVHDILLDNDLVPLIQLRDEQHITKKEENNDACLLFVFLYLKKTHLVCSYFHIRQQGNSAIPISQVSCITRPSVSGPLTNTQQHR